MDADLTKLLASVEPVAARMSINARHITMGFRPDDDPAERARQVFYRAHERWAIARDVLALASMADWAAMEPVFRAEAEALQQEASDAGKKSATQAAVDLGSVHPPAVVDVHLPETA